MSKLKYFDGTNWKVVNGQITGDTLPIGAIVPYGSATAPTNWLVCDGSAVSRTTYAELFAVIGTSFGSGDGSTTFNLPNLKGRVAVGQDTSDTSFDTMGETGGEKTHTLTINEIPSHNHDIGSRKIEVAKGTSDYWEVPYNSQELSYTFYSQYTGGGQAHNNLQPYQVVCYIIKANQSAGLVADVSNVYSTSETDTYSCDYFNDCNTYSTNEINTGKTWIDGKPIYRKIVVIDELPDNTAVAYSSGITDSVDKMLNITGTAMSKNTFTNAFPLPYIDKYSGSNNNIELVWLGTSKEVRITTDTNRTTLCAYIFLEYTKAN